VFDDFEAVEFLAQEINRSGALTFSELPSQELSAVNSLSFLKLFMELRTNATC